MKMDCLAYSFLTPVYERYKDETGDDADEQEMIETIKSLWTGEEKIPHQSKSERASLQAGIYGCPGYCSRIGFGN